jgi:hypothetical protein
MSQSNNIYIPPYELDETLYPVGFLTGIENSPLEIKMLRRNQFPQNIVSSHFNKLLNLEYIKDFKCFYTRTDCFVGSVKYHSLKDERRRFFLTKEHLASIKIAKSLNLEDKLGKPGNIVGAASYFNYKIGHIPLALKLWLKSKLENIEYSKTELTKVNSHIILQHIINLQNNFLYDNLYPWQLSTYQNKNSEKIAKAIFEEMIQVDKEFLLIPKHKETFQWLKEYNPNWIEKFLTN